MTDSVKPREIGGLLILLGFGLVISPIQTFADFYSDVLPLFTSGTWLACASPGSPTYAPGWSAVALGEAAFNVLFFGWALVSLYLFFKKHYWFPMLHSALMTTTLVYLLVDAWLVTLVVPGTEVFDRESLGGIGRTAFICLLWVPFLLISKQSKETFILGRAAEDADLGDAPTADPGSDASVGAT